MNPSVFIEVRYFLRGDSVLTPNGEGTVLVDENEIETELDLRNSEIMIKHKEAYSANAGNNPVMVDRESVFRLKE